MATHSQIIEHIHHPVNYTVYDTRWVPSSAKVAVFGAHARGTGALDILELDGAKLVPVTSITHKEPIKCATFGATDLVDRRPAVGDFAGKLTIYDLETGKETYSVQGHHANARFRECLYTCKVLFFFWFFGFFRFVPIFPPLFIF